MAGIDRVLILNMARRKLFSMISLKHTHVVVTYFECNVTFKIKASMLVYCILTVFLSFYYGIRTWNHADSSDVVIVDE